MAVWGVVGDSDIETISLSAVVPTMKLMRELFKEGDLIIVMDQNKGPDSWARAVAREVGAEIEFIKSREENALLEASTRILIVWNGSSKKPMRISEKAIKKGIPVTFFYPI